MSTPVRVVVEFPAGMKKLPKKQADALRDAFRTQLANIVKAKDMESLASLVFENVSNAPVGGGFSAKKPGKKGAKKGAKKGSKKSNK